MPEVNQEILVWARESSSLSLEEAAKKLQLKDTKTATGIEKLLAYENGKIPSRAVLLKMSEQYRKPLLTFYMKEPPKKGDRGQDFRTLPEGINPKEDLYVDVLIRDIKARQSLLRETLIDEDEDEALPFIGSANIQQDPLTLANTINQTLNFKLDEFRSYKGSFEAFKYLRTMTEKMGVFVFTCW